MKKFSALLMLVGIALLGAGSYLLLSNESSKNNNVSLTEKENKVDDSTNIDLNVLDTFVLKNEYVSYLKNVKTVVEDDKYIISCTQTEDINSQLYEFSYEYKDNVLYGSIGGDNALDEMMMFSILIQSLGAANGYSAEEINAGVKNIWYVENDYEANRYEMVNTGSEINFKMNLSKKIKFYTDDEMYVTTLYWENFPDIKSGKENYSFNGEVGNFTLYYSSMKKSLFICEKGNRTEKSYKSVLSFIEFYYGVNLKEEYKNKYSTLEDGSFYKLNIDTDYNGSLYSKDGYTITRIEFNV